jgi:hypothetical protein
MAASVALAMPTLAKGIIVSEKIHFVALVMQPWSGVAAQVGTNFVPIHIDTHEIGFMPVYDSIEKLRMDYPSCDYHLVKPKPTNNKQKGKHESRSHVATTSNENQKRARQSKRLHRAHKPTALRRRQ